MRKKSQYACQRANEGGACKSSSVPIDKNASECSVPERSLESQWSATATARRREGSTLNAPANFHFRSERIKCRLNLSHQVFL